MANKNFLESRLKPIESTRNYIEGREKTKTEHKLAVTLQLSLKCKNILVWPRRESERKKRGERQRRRSGICLKKEKPVLLLLALFFSLSPHRSNRKNMSCGRKGVITRQTCFQRAEREAKKGGEGREQGGEGRR